MSLARIGKLFAAQNVTQLVTVLTQLLLPPLFLRSYGVRLYGEWLALSAAITYLGTFNYGLQTYANMQMTIHYSRGEIQQTREVQSAGLRIILAVVAIFAIGLLVIFLLPVNSWLRLTIPQREAQWTLYILGCQIVAGMIFGFFSGSYMVIGVPHRGTNLGNVNQVVILFLQVAFVFRRSPFPFIAGAQLAVTLLSTLFLIFDFSRLAPDIRPSLRYWKPGSLRETLKPSAQYALLFSSNVLVYQVPMLLMQRILGPLTVVVFSVTRTVYSMCRRILYLLTNSIGPDITISYGKRDWGRLHKLYEFSERIVLVVTVPLTLGCMLATPLLLQVWLHKRTLYDPAVALLLGLTVSILGIKEHKYQFQFSSNQVQSISYAAVIAYGSQLVVAIPIMMKFGLNGYLGLWLGSEILQLFYLLHLNGVLFGKQARLDRTPVYQLFLLLTAGSLLILWPLYHVRNYPLVTQAALAVAISGISFAASYRLFRADEVRLFLWQKIGGRFRLMPARRG